MVLRGEGTALVGESAGVGHKELRALRCGEVIGLAGRLDMNATHMPVARARAGGRCLNRSRESVVAGEEGNGASRLQISISGDTPTTNQAVEGTVPIGAKHAAMPKG